MIYEDGTHRIQVAKKSDITPEQLSKLYGLDGKGIYYCPDTEKTYRDLDNEGLWFIQEKDTDKLIRNPIWKEVETYKNAEAAIPGGYIESLSDILTFTTWG